MKQEEKRMSYKQICEYILGDIDELDNKPRRLFQMLRNLINAMEVEKTDKKHAKYLLEIIDRREKEFYTFFPLTDRKYYGNDFERFIDNFTLFAEGCGDQYLQKATTEFKKIVSKVYRHQSKHVRGFICGDGLPNN